MPKSSRLTEMPQRPTPRGPPSLRTSSSYSDPAHHRTRTERSPKLADGRSPRGTQSDPLPQKKLGTRIADLESQLGQAQVELKSLKNQLVSAESAKKAAQEQLDRKSKQPPKVCDVVEIQDKHSAAMHSEKPTKKGNGTYEDLEQETDVFEIPMEKLSVESEIEPADQNEVKRNPLCISAISPMKSEQEGSSVNELELKNNEMSVLKTRLGETGKELEVLRRENEGLKGQLDDKLLKISSAESAIEELKLRLKQADQDLEKTKTDTAKINEKLEAAEKANEELEAEMRRLRVQAEQWRKAADAAASVLAGEAEANNERRMSERCGSMDKHYGSGYEHVGGYASYVGSLGSIDDTDDVFGSGKRRGSGMKMFGDLWKKKGHK